MSAFELQDDLKRIIAGAQAIDVRRFEEADMSQVRDDLLRAIDQLSTDAIDALGRVLRHYEGNPTDGTPSSGVDAEYPVGRDGTHFYFDIENLMSTSSGARRIADIAFMARWELERKRGALSRIRDYEDRWKLIAECGSARRRVTKSVTAVSLVIAQHEKTPSPLEDAYITEIRRSLETRRVYALFRRHIRKAGPFEPENARNCLRASGTAIATILGRDIYEDLRVSDRIQLRQIQARILDWLAGADEFDVETGRRIWQDLEACAALFLQVNHRAELLEHDRALIEDVLTTLTPAPPSASVPGALLDRLRLLLGRDAEFDEALERLAEGAFVEEWVALLERLRRALQQNPDHEEEAAKWNQEGPCRTETVQL